MSLTCVLALLGSFCGDLSLVLLCKYEVIKQTSVFALLYLDAEVIVQSSLSLEFITAALLPSITPNL